MRLLFLTVFIFLTELLQAQTQNTVQAPTLIFNKVEHDFGKVLYNKPVYYTFVYENAVSSEITLKSVVASCGCTTPEWDNKPVPAGGKAKLKVGYSASPVGVINRTITVTYLLEGKEYVQILSIKGEVVPAPTEAPSNRSIQLLKK